MIDFHALAGQYDTPLYVYDMDMLHARFDNFKRAFAATPALICYALKANSNLAIIKSLAERGSGADCVSAGEIMRALAAGIAHDKIIFSGVGKRDDEIRYALREHILFINIESEAELLRVEEMANDMQMRAPISIRINPNISAGTHPYIATGLEENKFGVALHKAAELYRYAQHSPALDIRGQHFHIGSQITELSPLQQAARIAVDFMHTLEKEGITISYFDIGGGVGIPYYRGEKCIDMETYAQLVRSALTGWSGTIICEPGRYIMGESGRLLVRVLYEKETPKKRFVIVDGAMNDLIRPSLYQAAHPIFLYPKQKIQHIKSIHTHADVVGPVCESGDYFAKNIALPPTQAGDLLVIDCAGAYGFSMSSNYNSRGRAAEVAVENGRAKLIRPRENMQEIIDKEQQALHIK